MVQVCVKGAIQRKEPLVAALTLAIILALILAITLALILEKVGQRSLWQYVFCVPTNYHIS